MKYLDNSLERAAGDYYFKHHVLPDGVKNPALAKNWSPFFKNFGFRVSQGYSEWYSKFNGVESDQYTSIDLYLYHIMPCLNRFDFWYAYTNKNLYSMFFPEELQPRTVIKRMNGIFYDSEGSVVEGIEAVRIVRSVGDKCIIKPTVRTADGRGVQMLDSSSVDDLGGFLNSYGKDYIVQVALSQHKDMSILNPTSVNTIRVFTYRDEAKRIHFHDAFLRVGGKGAFIDNASGGGGVFHIGEKGRIEDRMIRFKSSELSSLRKDFGLDAHFVPSFDRVVDTTKSLHERMPYFDWIGWDMAIEEGGRPRFIELNVTPSCELPQLSRGPVLGNYAEEIMHRVARAKQVDKFYFAHHVYGDAFSRTLEVRGLKLLGYACKSILQGIF